MHKLKYLQYAIIYIIEFKNLDIFLFKMVKVKSLKFSITKCFFYIKLSLINLLNIFVYL